MAFQRGAYDEAMSGGTKQSDMDDMLGRARELLDAKFMPAAVALAQAMHDRQVIRALVRAAREAADAVDSPTQEVVSRVRDGAEDAAARAEEAARSAMAAARKAGWTRSDLAALGLAPVSPKVGRPGRTERRGKPEPSEGAERVRSSDNTIGRTMPVLGDRGQTGDSSQSGEGVGGGGLGG